MRHGSNISGISVPFLKWAGGKRWFIQKHQNHFPDKFNVYFEPFLGSGAAFFFLKPQKAVLSDTNKDLIATYIQIRDNPQSIKELLKSHQHFHSKSYYYEVRATIPQCPVEKAARFLYLNRTCWNGLYRVNRRGEFNVPIGTKTAVTLDTDDFHAVSDMLQHVDILASDFETIIDRAGEGDFLFVDPPYTVRHNKNGFVKYNETLFSWNDQIRLQQALVRARSRGAMALITNAGHPSIQELYGDLGECVRLSRHSVLSGDPSRRSRVDEFIIRTWT